MQKLKSWGLGNFIAIVILFAILIVGGSLIGAHVGDNKTDDSVAGTSIMASPTVIKTIDYDGVDGKNALELLKVSHQVAATDTTDGAFVTKIDDTENTSDSFWMFYVNGQLAPMAADKYVTKNGEKIEWRFEQYQ